MPMVGTCSASVTALATVAGTISMMPGTGSDPAYRRIDVDTATGAVTGLF